MSGRGGVRRASSIHGRGARGAKIDDRPVAVVGRDDVIGRIVAGAVPDDQVAGGIDVDATAVTDQVVAFDPIIGVGGMNAGGVVLAVVFQNEG